MAALRKLHARAAMDVVGFVADAGARVFGERGVAGRLRFVRTSLEGV